MKNDYILLSEILRSRRMELGYSQRSLARAVGIHHSSINDIENGFRKRWDLTSLIDICNVLELNFVDVLVLSNYLPLNYGSKKIQEQILNRCKISKGNSYCIYCPVFNHYERRTNESN